MLLRSALLLITGAVLASGPARAEGFYLFSSVRVAEIKEKEVGGFKGARRPARAPLLVPPEDLNSADSFRSDDLRIWSSTSRTIWHLLPPKLLGMAETMRVVEAK